MVLSTWINSIYFIASGFNVWQQNAIYPEYFAFQSKFNEPAEVIFIFAVIEFMPTIFFEQCIYYVFCFGYFVSNFPRFFLHRGNANILLVSLITSQFSGVNLQNVLNNGISICIVIDGKTIPTFGISHCYLNYFDYQVEMRVSN